MTKKISSFEYKHSTNLGDEIQTIAAIKILKKLGLELDEIVDRKQIDTKNNINLLVNGYFDIDELEGLLQHHINPIFSNIHIACQSKRIDKGLIEKFKRYQPIGCRDRFTTTIFQKHGVDAFFNYCLTLTFDKRDKSIKGDKVFIVDLDSFVPLPNHLKKENIEYLHHDGFNLYSHQAKMILANELLERYKNEAKLIITSKLHCALPCIAMGIPVIFFGDERDKRLHLVKEFIPLHPYRTINTYTFYHSVKARKEQPNISRKQYRKMAIRKIRCHIKYYFYYKNKVNWSPESIDVEKIKKSILKNTADFVKKNTPNANI